jgi:hypothetical protein
MPENVVGIHMTKRTRGNHRVLPSAPQWEQFETYVLTSIHGVLEKMLSEMGGFDGAEGIDWLIEELFEQGHDLLSVLHERGSSYGEEVLYFQGEAGLVVFVVAKALRLLWAFENGVPLKKRNDDWMDLAGYCILRNAMVEHLYESEEEDDQQS